MKLRLFFVLSHLAISSVALANPWCVNTPDSDSQKEKHATSRQASETQWSALAKEIVFDIMSDADHTALGEYPSIQIERMKFPNAHAHSNNLVTISSGLLERIESSDEFAFIIAHEIGHLLLGHGKLKTPTTMGEYIDREKQADLMAMKLLKSSNFTAISGERLLDRLAKINSGTGKDASLSETHPAIEARLVYLRSSHP